jgi:ADP-ribose pyrophosphatase YjhB (NUDIX family)
MNYCSQCGSPVSKKIPAGDNRLRFVCERCEAIHYHNPKIVAGCIPEWEDSILLCRRAIEPKFGLWTIPAGFMELGESTEEAAIRETFEEAHAEVELAGLYAVLSLPNISQVYMIFRGRLKALDFKAGEESLAVQLFHRKAIPWDELAFPVVKDALRRYNEDVTRGQFLLHVGSLTAPLKL